MGRVILCTGKVATIPYYFDKLGIRVWSVEELCYCLYENAFLLEQDIVSNKLTGWLAKECDLPQLAEVLTPLLHQKNSLAAFVVKILEYVGYYNIQALTHVGNTLQAGASLSDYEKKKQRGDYLVTNRKYAKAIQEYDWLLMDIPAGEERVRAGVLHNKGVALAGMFLFEHAAREFLAAYELVHEPDYYRAYLAAKRMQLDDREYIAFVADLPEAYDISISLEREIDGILEEWEGSECLKNLSELKEIREEGRKSLYYEEIDRHTQAIKEQYREFVRT